MHKLVILIETPEDSLAFDQAWPQFLRVAESMPALRRETTSRVHGTLYGAADYAYQHELYFDTLQDAQEAMASPQGREAGRILQSISGGRLLLFLADHKEDNLENIQKYRATSEPSADEPDLT